MTDYQRYLASREWRVRRRDALAATKGLCGRCWGKATQVHHLTYERVGNELPEDLLPICSPCHKYLSAVTDYDPVAALPTLGNENELGEALSRLAMFARRPLSDDQDEALAQAAVNIAGEIVREWVQWSAKTFPSLPERRVGIAHAASLGVMFDDLDKDVRELAMFALGEATDIKPNGDVWQRWTVPLAWFEKGGAA